jgi:hypothetical protein
VERFAQELVIETSRSFLGIHEGTTSVDATGKIKPMKAGHGVMV